LNEDVLPSQTWSLESGLGDVLGATDIAHGYLIVIDLRDIVG